MKNHIIIAWRNLWRNKRRTLITVASVFFGVLLSTIMSSMQEGTYGNMIDMMVKLSSGYLQVQHPDYDEHKSINNTFEPTEEFIKQVKNTNGVTRVEKRLESFGLLSYGEKTKGGAIIGIEPEKDRELSNLQNWLHKGKFIKKGSRGVLLTYNIADYLNIRINDTIVLLSQGFHGASAAGIYPVKGILKFTTPQLNNLGVFMDIGTAQELFYAYGRVTALKVMVNNYDDVKHAEKELSGRFGEDYNIMTWKELQPEMVQFIESDRSSGAVMKGILYIVIGFGILGTIIMMMIERRKEFGVMIAIGMQKYKLSIILFFETIFIGLVGVISGFIVSIPVILAFVGNPVPLPPDVQEAYIEYGFEPYLFFTSNPDIFTNQVITVFIITFLIALYPIINTMRINVANALRT